MDLQRIIAASNGSDSVRSRVGIFTSALDQEERTIMLQNSSFVNTIAYSGVLHAY